MAHARMEVRITEYLNAREILLCLSVDFCPGGIMDVGEVADWDIQFMEAKQKNNTFLHHLQSTK